VNLSLFKEVWYSSERDLPVICGIAAQKLSFEVHSQKQQLDYGARTMEDIFGSWKCKAQTSFLVENLFSLITYCTGMCIDSKHMVDAFLYRIG
jgi:hypothetical protein